MKKRILIIYATYGSGHKKVAEYIRDYFKEQNSNLEFLLVDLLDYSNPIVGKVTQKLSDIFLLKLPSFWSFIYKITNNKLISDLSSLVSISIYKNKKIKKIISEFNPNLIISTHSFGGSLFKYYKKKKLINCKLLTVVTDYDVHRLWLKSCEKDHKFVIANKNEINLMAKKGINKKVIYPIGIPIYPKLSVDFNINLMKKQLGFASSKLLCIFFGGGGNGGTLSLPYIKSIIKNNYNINVIYIAGKNLSSKDKVDKWIKKYKTKNIKTLGYVDNVPDLINICDFVISKPGGTQITESLYFKKPLIMINSSGGQEIANYNYFVNNGYGVYFNNLKNFNSFMEQISENNSIMKDIKKNMLKNKFDKSKEKMYELSMQMLEK